ncbi:hypothetical protein CLV63_1554 [Murinocardiopsis flavida]|uniref:Uncharacterized protein n=1 Tax=Murinocardiopsis flavida TaxID=645275 RepID=A0A2P8C659_9ACTN|nr:hypothetical protein [Murinocardiopsis flavida]PSK80456.1 hypothetical protein CLV63_1554 [Murinocardiopsis flavida]
MPFAHTTTGPNGPAHLSIAHAGTAHAGTAPVVTVTDLSGTAAIRLEDMNTRIEAAQALLAGTPLSITYGPAHSDAW